MATASRTQSAAHKARRTRRLKGTTSKSARTAIKVAPPAHAPVDMAVVQRLSGLARLAQTQDPLRDDDKSPRAVAATVPTAPPAAAPAATPAAAMTDPFSFWTQWMSVWAPPAAAPQPGTLPPTLAPSFGSGVPAVSISPDALLDLQRDYMSRLTSLWTDFVEHPEAVSAPIEDARFADKAWQANPLASLTARNYLLNAEFLSRMAERIDADDKTRRRVQFAVQQWVDAAAPSNFYALNPKAQQLALETKGESLKAGLDNLIKDVAKGKISQSDETAFEVGRNVATTPGQVVFENALIQLIQYTPLTPKVRARPLLIVPPCINKFYVLDLQPENSLVRFGVEQGNTVFMVSWKNAHEAESKMTWDDYVELGPIAALNVAQEITGADKVNVLGFCVGGTLLSTALAVLAARGKEPAASLTLLTALLDFTNAGVLDIFIDERHVRMREQAMGAGGLMPGKDLANTFSSLRPNDLVWNYVVSNYLEGRAPRAFDLLYWNGDSTNLAGPMYAWYLRNTYLENSLMVPGKLKVCGAKVNLGRVKVPAYVFAAREDHIVPWEAAFASAHCLPGKGEGSVEFVLGASGHIAGTVNPASKNKRSFWVSKPSALPDDAETWLSSAQEMPGSWWRHWDAWLAKQGGPMVPAPKHLGSSSYRPIEPAPGRYVKEKA